MPGLDLIKITLDDVGRRTGEIAKTFGNSSLGTSDEDEELLVPFYDQAYTKVLMKMAIIRDPEGDRSGDPTGNEVDPATNYNSLIPFEGREALVHWVMSQWFDVKAQPGLAKQYKDKYIEELGEVRFTPGVTKKPKRIYRPFM